MANIKVDGQLVEVPDYYTLMQAAEAAAGEAGKTLLVLDTARVLLAGFTLYLLSGPVLTSWGVVTHRRRARHNAT